MSANREPRPPEEASVYETFVRVQFHEIDALGHVNNAAYLNYLEQAAIDHAVALGLDMDRLRQLGGVFVARRHEVVFLRPAFSGDLLRVVTWLDEARGARVERHYRVYRAPQLGAAMSCSGRLVRAANLPGEDEPIVRAATEWVFASPEGQPRRIPEEVAALFRAPAS
jgi:acyl-CoA thioester hydrolase